MYSVRHPARRYDREYIAYPISVFALCVAGSICRCGSVGKHGGFCFFSFPAVSMISCPHPPAPLPPPGKGESQSLFRRGLRPRHPCTEPPTALADAAMQEPGGGLARQVGGSTSIGGCPAGGLPGRSPARPTFSFISFPHPPAPLPVGKGAFSFHMQGASPLASPRPSRKRHGLHLRCGCPAGGLPGRSAADLAFSFISFPPSPRPPSPSGKGESQSLFRRGLRPRHPCTESPTAHADAAVQEPGGWFARQVAGSPCLKLYWLPPSPCPPLPVGKGAFSFLMQGASPLASPRPSRKRHGLHLRCGCPAGGLPSRSPARPVFSFISFPHPPAPLPVGKGAFSFLMQGASPLASPGAEPMVCCKPDRKQFPASGAARVQPQGICMAEATMPEAV